MIPSFGGGSAETPKPRGIPYLPKPALFGIVGLLAALVLLSSAPALKRLVQYIRIKFTLPFLPDRQVVSLVLAGVSIFLVLFFLAALVISLLRYPEEESGNAEPGEGEGTFEVEEVEPEPVPEEVEILDDGSTGGNRRILLYAFLLVSVAGVLFWSIRMYRSLPQRSAEEEDEETQALKRELKSASQLSLSRLLEAGDNRTAVIAAYALMSECFKKGGFTQTPSQTPYEFMQYALAAVVKKWANLPAKQLLRLTELYELAKFSDHTIEENHRKSALLCLREIEGAL